MSYTYNFLKQIDENVDFFEIQIILLIKMKNITQNSIFYN